MSTSLLITPPFSRTNTPYPATCYIKGFLNTINKKSFQLDLSLETILRIFSHDGLSELFNAVNDKKLTDNSQRILSLKDEYISTIDIVIGFLQGRYQTMSQILAEGDILPQAYRFQNIPDIESAFGEIGYSDRAKYICTLYLEDLIDFISEAVDENFGFSRYADHLGRYAGSFDHLEEKLNEENSIIDNIKMVAFKFNYPSERINAKSHHWALHLVALK